MPDPSAARAGVPRDGEEGRAIIAQVRRPAGALHVVGLQGRTRDDGAAGRAVHDRRQRQRRARDSRRAGLRQGDRAGGPSSSSISPTSAIRRLAGTYLAACTDLRGAARRSRPSATSTPRASTPSSPPSSRGSRPTRCASTTARAASEPLSRPGGHRRRTDLGELLARALRRAIDQERALERLHAASGAETGRACARSSRSSRGPLHRARTRTGCAPGSCRSGAPSATRS